MHEPSTYGDVVDAWAAKGFTPVESETRARDLAASILGSDVERGVARDTVLQLADVFVGRRLLPEAGALISALVRELDEAEDSDARTECARSVVRRVIDLALDAEGGPDLALLEAVASVDPRADPPLEAVVAEALYERALALKDRGQIESSDGLLLASVEAAEALQARFGSSVAADVQGFVAWAQYNAAGALVQLRRDDEAKVIFAGLAERFRTSEAPMLRDVAAFAAVRHRMTLAVPDPPYDIQSNKMDDALIAEEQAARRGVLKRMVRRRSDGVALARAKERLEAARQLHREAAWVLGTYRLNGWPFVLYLRSFAEEGFVGQGRLDEGEPVTYFVQTIGPGFESQLVRLLGAERSVIAVGNQDTVFQNDVPVPRLFLPFDGWQGVVSALIHNAHAIVCELDVLTPGVEWELNELRAHGRADDTLIVLPASDDSSTTLRELISGVYRDPRAADAVPVPQMDEMVDGFPHVVREDQLPADSLDDVPGFGERLVEMDTLMTIDHEARLRRLAARWDVASW